MTPDLLLALAAFAFVTSITPGPNNIMLLASGANFGFRRTVPHLLGIMTGGFAMLLALGFGLGGLFVAVPELHMVLRYLGGAYLLYLAWKIAGSGAVKPGGGAERPMTLLQAAAFQWVNPKAWVMKLGAITTYTPQDGFFVNILVVGLVFYLVNLPSIASWAGFGVAMRRLLSSPAQVRAFNITMAALLVLSLYPLVTG
ncbi:MAG TPA: LysE family translocator [Alphaproteobacteria bacterium]|nr:LysE family translocator [Alphaproteobacteria bacterium]